MAALTPEDIANMALTLITEGEISSLDDDSRAARLLNLHYDNTRQVELMKHAWSFAIKRADLEPTDLGSDAAPYRYHYELPTDCLRLLPIRADGSHDGLLTTYVLESDGIRNDTIGSAVLAGFSGSFDDGFSSIENSVQRIRYIADFIDPNDWDAMFVELLAAALAIKIAHPLTGKQSLVQSAQQAYAMALDQARRVQAIQRQGRFY